MQVVAKAEPHEKFVRDGVNLRAGLNISLTEALSGFTRDFELLNGSAVFLNKTGVMEKLCRKLYLMRKRRELIQTPHPTTNDFQWYISFLLLQQFES